jgi:general transcription factor 3C polypeptide 3 (transcription factor C subunit 4)
LAKVNQAFLAADYSTALDLVSEVIRINAETHQAWTALASIFQEQGEPTRALSAMVYAAHLRPKDVSGWMTCASFALDIATEDDTSNLKTARLCYSAALRADATNLEARLGKAAICHTLGHYAQAIQEYNLILKNHPTDLEIVRKLAETCVDNKYSGTSVLSAVTAYQRFFDYITTTPTAGELSELWYDIGIYVDLLSSADENSRAVQQLRLLARWMVGRASETFWDGVEDDREWDPDNDRKSQVPSFTEIHIDGQPYDLPIDLRARLAILRLRLSDWQEAKASGILCPTLERTRPLTV